MVAEAGGGGGDGVVVVAPSGFGVGFVVLEADGPEFAEAEAQEAVDFFEVVVVQVFSDEGDELVGSRGAQVDFPEAHEGPVKLFEPGGDVLLQDAGDESGEGVKEVEVPG